jgi:hypothetical protein
VYDISHSDLPLELDPAALPLNPGTFCIRVGTVDAVERRNISKLLITRGHNGFDLMQF